MGDYTTMGISNMRNKIIGKNIRSVFFFVLNSNEFDLTEIEHENKIKSLANCVTHARTQIVQHTKTNTPEPKGKKNKTNKRATAQFYMS